MQAGRVFNGVVLIKETRKNKSGARMWLSRCSCGKEFEVEGDAILRGNTKSCGCLHRKRTSEVHKTHGQSGSRIYKVWGSIKSRCSNPKNEEYHNYGGRGIRVCDDWNSNFESFYEWSLDNGYTECLTIDRIDNDKGYSPDNCRWTTTLEQGRNKRLSKKNRSGCSGVSHYTKGGNYEWTVLINVRRKAYYLGSYKNLEDAIEARRQGEIKHWGKEYQDFDKILADLELDKGDGNNTN